jgi:hypothetical protein
MDKYPHIIGKQIFDLEFSSKQESQILQDKISSIFNSRLIDEMNILFDRLIPSNKIIKLDTLSIDIGSISFESLESELPNKLIQKLEQELNLILLHDNSATTAESDVIFQDDKKGSYLQLLEFFLLKGTFPWWVSTIEGPSISEVLEFLLLHSSLKLKELILRVGKNSYSRKRLVYQFSEQQIKYIIVLLEPEEAEFIFEYHHNVVQVQREVYLVKNQESDFKREVWFLIITFLIIDRGSHFNRKEFVRNMLSGMASHFNTNFSELIALFAAGLKIESPELKNIDSLQSIILELFVESVSVPQKEALVNNEIIKKDLFKLSYDLDLLRYYLTFGSFPWWSSYLDQQSLEKILTEMLTIQPKTMAVMLHNVGKQQYSRKLLIKTFSEEILLSIVNLLEPDQTEFISDYIAEAKEINKRDSKLKVQSQDLTEAVWEFVFEYLLVDRGSMFNQQMFLESNIRNLANRFNTNYTDILVFLVQSIRGRHQASGRHISLIQDLNKLYNLLIKDPKSSFLNLDEKTIDYKVPELAEAKGLRDVLYYWLKMGHFPWWAGKFAKLGASKLLEQLIRESPTDALLFFKFSGKSLTSQRRMLNQIPATILFKLFRNLPHGNKAVRYTENIILLFSESPFFQSLERKNLEPIALASLWNMYITNYYESFKAGDFLKFLILNLSISSNLSLKNIVSFLNNLVLDNSVRTQLKKIFRNLESNVFQSNTYLSNTQLPIWTEHPNIDMILTQQLRSESIKDSLITPDNVFDEATFILRYFLQFSKIPEKYIQNSTVSVNSFLKHLLVFLQKNSPSKLDLILNSEKYAAENLFRLHDIFQQSSSIEENNLKNLLTTKIERNILLFIRQKGGISISEKSLIQFIEKLTKDILAADSINSIFRLLLKYPSVSVHFANFLKESNVYDLLNYEHKKNDTLTQEIKNLNIWLTSLLTDWLDRERFEFFIRSFNLLIVGGIVEVGNINSYFKQFLDFLADSNYQLMLKLISSVSTSINTIDESGRSTIVQIPEISKLVSHYKKMEEVMADLNTDLEKSEKSLFEKLLNTDINKLKEWEQIQLKEEFKEQEQIEKKKSTDEILSDKDSIYIHNAGLVILHPFLSTYFNRLNMFENGDFKTDELRHRAVHLLQYLAFGTQSNEEYELVLNKILCNIPIDEPVSAGIEMTENEIAVSAELLNAILVQWDKLKNTSPESFQSSFLQRDGALSRIEENWNLKVESRGYDVLLNTLPWGLGMIKTSWMPEFIYVEWI